MRPWCLFISKSHTGAGWLAVCLAAAVLDHPVAPLIVLQLSSSFRPCCLLCLHSTSHQPPLRAEKYGVWPGMVSGPLSVVCYT